MGPWPFESLHYYGIHKAISFSGGKDLLLGTRGKGLRKERVIFKRVFEGL